MGPFNDGVDRWVHRDSGVIKLLEVNPRHSQSHALLFELVDGAANHQCMVRVALDRPPQFPFRRGPYAVAAKWFLRSFDDGVVRRTPSAEQLTELGRRIPGVQARVLVGEGDRLSEDAVRDSYSFELAQVFVGAANRTELTEKYRECLTRPPFEIAEA